MASNLLLVAGPVIGLAALRALGPVRPLPAIVTAAVCQLVTFYGYAHFWRPFVAPLFARPAGDRPVMIATIQPTLAGRVSVFVSLVVVSTLIAGLFLVAQFLISPGASDSPATG